MCHGMGKDVCLCESKDMCHRVTGHFGVVPFGVGTLAWFRLAWVLFGVRSVWRGHFGVAILAWVTLAWTFWHGHFGVRSLWRGVTLALGHFGLGSLWRGVTLTSG
jgi:hypothetical protein